VRGVIISTEQDANSNWLVRALNMLNTLAFQLFYFYIRQGGYVSALVCLSVSRLTQKPVDERQWIFLGDVEGMTGNN